MADGHLNKCKECARVDVRKNRALRASYYRKYDMARASRPDRVIARKEYTQTKAGKLSAMKGRRVYWGKYPDKRRAHNMASNAIRDGKLIRQPCEKCGEQKADAHHDDYSKPLDVRWLCRGHHSQYHKEERRKKA